MFFYKLKYNAPVTLTFSLLCVLVLILSKNIPGFLESYFVLPSRLDFNPASKLDYIRMVSYAFGHLGLNHLLSNLTIILLIGPILEEKYGSKLLFIMFFITALVNGILNVTFFTTQVAGASGIVFMLILLVSITNINNREIPMTFLFVLGLYLSKEVIAAFSPDNVSQLAHIMGAVCGAFFGFTFRHKRLDGKRETPSGPVPVMKPRKRSDFNLK